MCNNCNGGGLLNALFGRSNGCGCNNNNCGCYDAYYAAQYGLNNCGCNQGCGCNSYGGYSAATVNSQNGAFNGNGFSFNAVSTYGGYGCNSCNQGCGCNNGCNNGCNGGRSGGCGCGCNG